MCVSVHRGHAGVGGVSVFRGNAAYAAGAGPASAAASCSVSNLGFNNARGWGLGARKEGARPGSAPEPLLGVLELHRTHWS